MKIAFFGIGIMGLPMAKHILQAGYNVNVWNRTSSRVAPLTDLGAVLCKTPSEAAQDANIIITMLLDGPTTDAVLFNKDESGRSPVEVMAKDAIVIVMSSIAVDAAHRQAFQIEAAGRRYIDAPVSGGEKGAIDGALTIMAGGKIEDIEAALPVLSVMGSVTRVGDTGTGQLAKLANQMIVGITIGAVSEAMLLLKEGGADLTAVHRALIGGFADSTIWRQHGERIVKQNFVPGARASVQLKDMRTAAEQAKAERLRLPILDLVHELYADMCSHGRGDLDHSGLYLELAERAKGRSNLRPAGS